MKKIYTLAAAAMMAASLSAQVNVADLNEVYAIGTAVESGWSMGGPKMPVLSEGVFQGSMILVNGELKFNYEKDNWGAWVYATAAEAPIAALGEYDVTLADNGDNKFDCQLMGAYQLTLDLNTNLLTVTDAPYIYVVGDATPGGWNLGEAVPLTGNGQTYTGTVNLGSGEFKFLASNADFNSSIMAAAPSTDMVLGEAMAANLGGNDNKWLCHEAGVYNVTVALGENSTVTITKNENAFVPTSFNLVGTAVNGPVNCVTDGIFKYCGAIGEGAFRISATDGETTKWVKLVDEEEDYFTYTDVEDEALTLEAEAEDAGDYQLVINTLSMTIDLDWYEAWETLYIVGSFNGWSFGEMTKTGDNEFTWVGDINLAQDGAGNEIAEEVKFSGVDNFDEPEMMLHPYVANESLKDALYCYNGGNDNKWLVTETANYTIVVNTLEQTVTVTTAPSGIENVEAAAAAEAVYYNLQGMRVANPERGIFIRVQGNTATKVLVK